MNERYEELRDAAKDAGLTVRPARAGIEVLRRGKVIGTARSPWGAFRVIVNVRIEGATVEDAHDWDADPEKWMHCENFLWPDYSGMPENTEGREKAINRLERRFAELLD